MRAVLPERYACSFSLSLSREIRAAYFGAWRRHAETHRAGVADDALKPGRATRSAGGRSSRWAAAPACWRASFENRMGELGTRSFSVYTVYRSFPTLLHLLLDFYRNLFHTYLPHFSWVSEPEIATAALVHILRYGHLLASPDQPEPSRIATRRNPTPQLHDGRDPARLSHLSRPPSLWIANRRR